MIATVTDRGRTSKTVAVTGVRDGDNVLNAALRAANETRGSLFGWKVRDMGLGDYVVTLHTD